MGVYQFEMFKVKRGGIGEIISIKDMNDKLVFEKQEVLLYPDELTEETFINIYDKSNSEDWSYLLKEEKMEH